MAELDRFPGHRMEDGGARRDIEKHPMLFFYEYKIQNNSIFFSNNLKFFTITFDQFNASLLKKSIHFIQSFKNLPDPKLLNGSVCLSCSPGNYNSLKI